MPISSSEQTFLSQSTLFLDLMLRDLGFSKLEDLPFHGRSKVQAVDPIPIQDYANLSDRELTAVQEAYYSPVGVAALLPTTPLLPDRIQAARHPVHDIAEQLANVIPSKYGLEHPLENHSEVLNRFGAADGTVKVYNLQKSPAASGYREQGETSDAFAMHHDGLGSAGTVQTVFLYCGSPPLSGGFTYFQN